MATAAKKETASLHEGDVAPDFKLPTDEGTFCLSDFKGKKNVLVYFYPKDDTPGCTTQACDIRDLKKEFDKVNAVVIGISKDDVTSHGKFRVKHKLVHTLGADEDGSVCEAYGAWGEKNNYGKKYMGIIRSSFLVDKNGKIAKAWPNVKAEGSMDKALEAAKALV